MESNNTTTKQIISIIAAIGENRGLGKEGKLLWRLPSDLKRFKKITVGHPIIMGRKTFESIGRPLPDRLNIVLTKNPDFAHEGVVVFSELHDALEHAQKAPGGEEVFIIGGGEIYTQSITICDRLYLTQIKESRDADTFFPEYTNMFTKKISQESDEESGVPYSFIIYER